VKAMLSMATPMPGVALAYEDLDADPWLLNVANGTLDLRTGELRPHRREDLCSKLAPVAFDPTATCPRWTTFIYDIMQGNEALVGFLQRMVGVALSGDVSEQHLFFLYGLGANGKGTFVTTVQALMGDYARQAAPNLLLERNSSHPTELADLFRARLVASVEVDKGRKLAEGLVKQLTGGDTVKARRMREDFWEFLPSHKVWLAANHKPVVKGHDHGIWRRILTVPFLATFDAEKRDTELPAKLRAELPGILRWALDGCLAWQRDGLQPPPEVRLATEEYREEMDTLRPFIEDRCLVGPDQRVSSGDLYREYKAWAEAMGVDHVMSQIGLGRALAERGYKVTRVGKDRTRGFEGIGLPSVFDRPNVSRNGAEQGQADG
jgi:putative DNA primase/helicase